MFILSAGWEIRQHQVVFWLPVRHVMETSRLPGNQCPVHRLPVTAARPRRIFTVFRYLRWTAMNHKIYGSARKMCKWCIKYLLSYNILYHLWEGGLKMRYSPSSWYHMCPERLSGCQQEKMDEKLRVFRFTHVLFDLAGLYIRWWNGGVRILRWSFKRRPWREKAMPRDFILYHSEKWLMKKFY